MDTSEILPKNPVSDSLEFWRWIGASDVASPLEILPLSCPIVPVMIPGATPTHPLFPEDQIFLWLPGLSSNRFAFCTRNKIPGPSPGEGQDLGISSSPPFPVSPATFIAWDTKMAPPCPYHPIPVAKALSPAEMDELARRVVQLAGEEENDYPRPPHVLRNDKKCLILAALAEMGCLSGFVPPSGLTPSSAGVNSLEKR